MPWINLQVLLFFLYVFYFEVALLLVFTKFVIHVKGDTS
ncbi:hypothetical protein RV17_GL001910 [Enterococcus thailandicus]|nr:hypothetical protein RV17_GL001910 [Enterococcus thailandicus]